ncbi:MAG: hypothetical protein H6607_13480 [Flavobacteriales bacterium]|nr:hypothetical protein [Flavobacteriales bacterium]
MSKKFLRLFLAFFVCTTVAAGVFADGDLDNQVLKNLNQNSTRHEFNFTNHAHSGQPLEASVNKFFEVSEDDEELLSEVQVFAVFLDYDYQLFSQINLESIGIKFQATDFLNHLPNRLSSRYKLCEVFLL